MSYKFKIKKVYVVAEGGSIYALTPKRAADFLFDGAFMGEMPDPYDYGQLLKRFPRNLWRDEYGRPQQSYNDHPLWEPLDWPAFEYVFTFEYLFPDDPRVDDLPEQ